MVRYSSTDEETSLLALGDEATLVHYRLNAVLALVHGEDDVAAKRGMLRNLMANGPMTVPQLAALRPVSRQYVQKVVNALEAQGLVERQPNSAHRRSKLVALTAKGCADLAQIAAREAPLLEVAKAAVPGAGEVETAVTVLRNIRRHLDDVIADLKDEGNDG